MEILNYSDGLPGTNLIATFDIYFGPQWGMTFKRWRLLRGKHGPFISGPSYSEDSETGKKIYHPYIEFSKEKKAEFDAKVLSLIREIYGAPK